MSVETCVHCRFWKSYDDGFGECRKNAPPASVGEEKQWAVWPITVSSDWCGKWRPAKGKGNDETISPSQMLIMEYLRNEPDGAMGKEISESTKITFSTTRMMLWRLSKKGLVRKLGRRWFVVEHTSTETEEL